MNTENLLGSELPVYVGVVVFFNATRGFGFIQWAIDGVVQKDIFVHFSDLDVPEGTFKTLYKNQRTSFSIGCNRDGIPKAINVKILQH